MELIFSFILIGIYCFVSILSLTLVQGVLIQNYALLKYYTDPNENVKLALMAQIIAFTSILVYITLVPLDVYATVNHYKTFI